MKRSWYICQVGDIVDRYIIILCKLDNLVEFDFAFTAFIKLILLTGYPQNLGYVLLL